MSDKINLGRPKNLAQFVKALDQKVLNLNGSDFNNKTLKWGFAKGFYFSAKPQSDGTAKAKDKLKELVIAAYPSDSKKKNAGQGISHEKQEDIAALVFAPIYSNNRLNGTDLEKFRNLVREHPTDEDTHTKYKKSDTYTKSKIESAFITSKKETMYSKPNDDNKNKKKYSSSYINKKMRGLIGASKTKEAKTIGSNAKKPGGRSKGPALAGQSSIGKPALIDQSLGRQTYATIGLHEKRQSSKETDAAFVHQSGTSPLNDQNTPVSLQWSATNNSGPAMLSPITSRTDIVSDVYADEEIVASYGQLDDSNEDNSAPTVSQSPAAQAASSPVQAFVDNAKSQDRHDDNAKSQDPHDDIFSIFDDAPLDPPQPDLSDMADVDDDNPFEQFESGANSHKDKDIPLKEKDKKNNPFLSGVE